MTDVVRILGMLLCWICILELVFFMIKYVRVIHPLKKQKRNENLLAPPPFWTFAYHTVVGILFLAMFFGFLARFAQDHPPTPITFVMPVILGAFVVVLRQFYKYYQRILEGSDDAASKQEHPGLQG
jgi:hypothetical protein